MSNANDNPNIPLDERRIQVFDFAGLGELLGGNIPRYQANVVGTDVWGTSRQSKKAAKAACIAAWNKLHGNQEQ